MIERLREIFGSDEFIISSAVFPSIDMERLARELSLEAAGADRGKNGQPETASKQPDHVEQQAISRVDALRRIGLENFETNRRVYSERLNNAVAARMLVETEANEAKARFAEEVIKWRARMITPRERVEECHRWRVHFREINQLDFRPAKHAAGWGSVIGLSLLMILAESAGNAYLFSQNNPLGILGGLIAAILVSLVNVSMSTALGMWVRFANVDILRSPFRKIFGVFAALTWLTFGIGYNAAVAHFRDAVETTLEWREAGEMAIQTLMENVVLLNTMESYVLFFLGFFISIVSLSKGYNSSDPYPGYSKVEQAVVDAHENYILHLDEFIDKLSEHRIEAVEALHSARDEIERQVRDSVDALYGQQALISNLSPFLTQCDIAVNYLLSIYRDANKAARDDDPPSYFHEKLTFEKFSPSAADDEQRTVAEKQAREVSAMVEESIKEIFEVYNEAVQSHTEIDELEGKYKKPIEKPRTPTGEGIGPSPATAAPDGKDDV